MPIFLAGTAGWGGGGLGGPGLGWGVGVANIGLCPACLLEDMPDGTGNHVAKPGMVRDILRHSETFCDTMRPA